MLNPKEIFAILSTALVLAIILSLLESWPIFFTALLMLLIVIIMNVLVKKITSFYLGTEIEISLWEFRRYGYKTHQHFKKPVPVGIFIPLIIKLISMGLLNWMACLTFEVKGKIYRAAKKHSIYAFSEITEEEIGRIASAGIIANLVLALIGYLIGYTNFAVINLSYALFNLIPISNLDGSKVFFGGKIFWVFLATITAIATFAVMVIA